MNHPNEIALLRYIMEIVPYEAWEVASLDHKSDPKGEWVLHTDARAAIAAAVEQERGETQVVLERLSDAARDNGYPEIVEVLQAVSDEIITQRGPSRDYRSLCQQLAEGLRVVKDLINESEGVTGLHANGDVASWDEISPGGEFEGWLPDIDALLQEFEEIDR